VKLISCAICGALKDPETIEGCYANAKKHGLDHLLIPPRTLMGKDDYAHIWRDEEFGLPTVEWGPLAERRGPC
jgi:hypothetical protein